MNFAKLRSIIQPHELLYSFWTKVCLGKISIHVHGFYNRGPLKQMKFRVLMVCHMIIINNNKLNIQ